MHRAAAVAVVLLLAVQPATAIAGVDGPAAGPPSDATAPDQRAVDTASPTIRIDTVLSLTPDRPGSIGVVQTFDTPDAVTELRVTLDPESTVTTTEGFSQVDSQTWAWDGETADPQLSYRMAANRTTERDGPMGAQGTFLYADVGEWALVQQPNIGLRWRYRGEESVSVERSTRVDGQGAVGGATAFLGAYEEHTRQVAGQEIRLIVPEAATLADPPEEVLDGLGNASRELRIGDRDPTVFAVAAPTNRVDWAVQGLQIGDTDFWARANQPIDEVGNTWLHEYVHTRQSFRTADSGRWITEASATWYAGLLSHQQEGVGFAALSRFLERGTVDPQAGSVLAEPTDWRNNANYWKGALVSGELDRRIRLRTDGGATFQRVLAALNDRTEPVTNEDVLAAVAGAATESTHDAATRLTTTGDAPDVWDRAAHREAFGGETALLESRFDPATDVGVRGPYREAPVPLPATVATGETLSVRTTVENLGGATGEYAVTLRVDDESVDGASGTLAPGDTANATLSHRFTEPGEYTVSVAGEQFEVRVREPATPTVTDLAVEPTTVERGGEVTVTATVTNDRSVPGNATVAFTRNGETVTTRTITVGAGGTATVTATVRLPEAGSYRIGAGDRTVDVRAEAPATATATRTTSPGFGVPVAALSILVAFGLLRREPSG